MIGTKASNWYDRWVFMALGLLLFFLLSEVLLRAVVGAPSLAPGCDRERVSLLQPSQTPPGYTLRPGAVARAWDANVTVNSLGLRGGEVAAKEPGTLRIAMLGDELVFGEGLPLDETCARQLELQLASHSGAIEVINLGLGGYDTLDSVRRLGQVVETLNPDLVLLISKPDDLGVRSENRAYMEKAERYDSPLYASRLMHWIGTFLDSKPGFTDNLEFNDPLRWQTENEAWIIEVEPNSELREAMEYIQSVINPMARGTPFRNMLSWYTSRKRIGKLRFAVQELRDLAAAHDFQVVAVQIPYLDPAPDLQRAFRIAAAIVAAEFLAVGFQVLDLGPVISNLEPSAWETLSTAPLDYTATGQRFIAGQITRFLDKNALVER